MCDVSDPQHALQPAFEDAQALQHDLQLLLEHPNPADPPLHHPQGPLSLPAQVLHVRSAYFNALLSPAWNAAPLAKHNASKPVLQDVLEFLVTGLVTLSCSDAAIPHNLSLASLAHEMLLDELEAIVISHIRRKSLTNSNFQLYLSHLTTPSPSHAAALPPPPPPPPPPSIQTLLSSHLLSNFAHLRRTLRTDARSVACVWRLLTLASSQRPIADLKPFATYLSRVASATLLSILRHEPAHNQHAMRAFLLSFPSPIFAAHFEHPNMFSPADLLSKYRHDALLATQKLPPPRTRFLCESPHPHPRAARLEATIRHVKLPQRNVYSRLTFDRRSSLACGAKIALYITDPRKDNEAHSYLSGSRLPADLTLPASQFWYAFSSADYVLHAPRDARSQSRWGWRFFVEGVAPEIDALETRNQGKLWT